VNETTLRRIIREELAAYDLRQAKAEHERVLARHAREQQRLTDHHESYQQRREIEQDFR
jgi:hypothetical protein